MISVLAILLIAVVLLLCLMQTLLVIGYSWFHRDAKSYELPDEDRRLPKAAIILCLRGHEETTLDCLAELIGQDYPDFDLHIAFDSQQDAAVEQVQDFFENRNLRAHLHFFEPRNNCSYKCAGIVHVLSELNRDVEFVAFCDGDAIVDSQWLRDLIRPMMDDLAIGATTGNRWFSPYVPEFGALVRQQWNAAAVVQMQAYDIAWGGSMCVRADAIEQCNLKEIWSKSFCEDTGLTRALKKQQLTVHRVPNLVIENRETTSLADCFSWISRQLLTVRLHHSGWPLVFAHGVTTGVASIVAPVAAVLLFATGYFYEGRSVLLVWIVYQILNYVLLKFIEHCNRKAIAERTSNDAPASDASAEKGILALLGLQLLHPFAAIRAATMRTVNWRGVAYAIKNSGIKVLSSDRK